MTTNLRKYEDDLDNLISEGESLLVAMQKECYPQEYEEGYKEALGEKFENFDKKLPNFKNNYQQWYSESLSIIKQLLPDRLDDFIKQYEKPKTRKKDITFENYSIEDYLTGLTVTQSVTKKEVVGPEAALPRYQQQLNILKSVKKRFESTLFDITQLVQADLFDSELEASSELKKKGFFRGAGAIAGVVLEKHLSQVCKNHNISVRKKKPSISDFNDILKKNSVYEVPTWRKIQHLADLRNLCDHDKKREPESDDIEELIEGVEKITKTIF